jgi:hypothetical protein
VTAKVVDYYGFAIRRLAATRPLPEHFSAPIPPSPRPATSAGDVDPGEGSPEGLPATEPAPEPA